jgi:hypothetical protein
MSRRGSSSVGLGGVRCLCTILFAELFLILLGNVAIDARGLADGLQRKFQQLRKLLVVLFQQPQGSQGLDACCVPGGVGELAGGKRVLVDGYRSVGGLCRDRRRLGVVVRLLRLVSRL